MTNEEKIKLAKLVGRTIEEFKDYDLRRLTSFNINRYNPAKNINQKLEIWKVLSEDEREDISAIWDNKVAPGKEVQFLNWFLNEGEEFCKSVLQVVESREK